MADPVTRRTFLGSASAATVGLVASTPSAGAPATTTQPDAPRLPAKILLRAGLADDLLQQCRALSDQVTISRDVPLADAHVIFGGVNAEELGAAKALRWVQFGAAGVEGLPLVELDRLGVTLTNAQGCYAPEIAEHTFGLLFALTRGIAHQARQNRWGFRDGRGGGESDGKLVEMRGMTMGIIGLGGIGREVARRARAMDMKVFAVDVEPMLAERFAMVDEVRLVDAGGLDDLLKRSDVVVSCAPLTERSRGMLGTGQFGLMKQGGYFINVSRGKVVRTDALLEALKTGHLAGAGLDVTDPEPLPPDHPLWGLPNVVVTSHIAGRSQFSWPRVEKVFADNVARYVRGLPLLNQVDKSKGY